LRKNILRKGGEKYIMKKMLILSLCVLFGGSIMLVAGCAPKQEAENQAPAVEEQAPAAMETPAADLTPAAVQTPGAAAGEQAPAEE
jgi:hypothetical protein